MKAVLKNYRQAPRKVRLVADLIRGKRVEEAQLALSFLPKRAATPMLKLLNSAVANASDASTEDLIVREIRVDKGVVLKRFMPRARGAAHSIHKHASHVVLVLGEKPEKKGKKAEKPEKVEAKAAPKKRATKKASK